MCKSKPPPKVTIIPRLGSTASENEASLPSVLPDPPPASNRSEKQRLFTVNEEVSSLEESAQTQRERLAEAQRRLAKGRR